MRKFTDSLLFGIIFVLAAFAWWMMDLAGQLPDLNPKELAPMTVSTVVIIAAPALLVATLIAFFRAVSNANPKKFWGWVTFGTALTAGALAVALWITGMQQLQLGFRTGVWFSAIFALVSLIGLILALTDAIPVPVKLTPEEKKAAKKQAAADRKAEKRDQAKEERAAKRRADKEAKAEAKRERKDKAQEEQVEFLTGELGVDESGAPEVTEVAVGGEADAGGEAVASETDWELLAETPEKNVVEIEEVEEVAEAEEPDRRDPSKQ